LSFFGVAFTSMFLPGLAPRAVQPRRFRCLLIVGLNAGDRVFRLWCGALARVAEDVYASRGAGDAAGGGGGRGECASADAEYACTSKGRSRRPVAAAFGEGTGARRRAGLGDPDFEPAFSRASFPLIGTSLDYFEFRKLQLADGDFPLFAGGLRRRRMRVGGGKMNLKAGRVAEIRGSQAS